ncbi:iron ABC transporter permease [Salinirubellus salinus]|jgi:iron(III) transport system permease protein|uniref:Iron ABC transporter permease n=1 Tax=Salinirubellus salinus TaxID=1364945 RepID=A0A9E7R4L4_9EURY|nr:iron ABC transporter permease [Salinirubellus salinus]UWM55694.1 iron ABC transporter permease [Salinirubellus salinus]
MSTRSRLAALRGGDEELPVGLTLLSAAIAAVVLSPLLWVLASALDASDWLRLLTRPTTVQVFLNSALLVVGVTTASILLGVPTAYLTVRTDLPARRAFTVLLAMPLVVPSYIGAFAFVSAFGPRGQLQDLLAPFGVEQLPSIYGLGGTVLVLTLYTYPYVYITTRASLQSMDTRLVDAARTLRHTKWQAFKRVTVPQIRPAVAAGALLVALYTLSDFGTPAIMRFDAFTRVIFVEYNDVLGGGRDLASLLSLQLVVVTFVILAVESRVRGSGVESDRTGRGTTVRLGRWRWPAVAACLAVASLALVVPLGILALWLVRGSATPSLAFQPTYALNSVAVAAAAALVCALAALPIAYLSTRSDHPLPWLLERASYVGYAVPGVVMGLALVFFGARYGGNLYREGLILLPLLIFAYVVRFLPQALGSSRAAFLGVSNTLPEAARTLGHTPREAFRRVTFPLVLPGVLGGAALVFLTTMKELPATLLLRPPEFKTLVTYIWSVQQSGYYGQAAFPAFVLLFVSALSMLVILATEKYELGGGDQDE